jgi:hypothetical protein
LLEVGHTDLLSAELPSAILPCLERAKTRSSSEVRSGTELTRRLLTKDILL